ncbi:MAG: hypothetical protein HYU75_02180 [Betaproteobacteria bacterium]|nr:hypothetical protein [Betaproteobacteria bacterium]
MYDKGRMTPRERLYAAMALKEPDRVPILPSSRMFGIHDLGYTMEDCFKDGEKYVESQVRMVTEYAHDAVWSMYEMPVERALGQKMSTPKDDNAHPLAPLINSPEDLANLPKNLVLRGKGWTDYFLAITKSLKKKVGDAVPVMGFVPSPIRQACMLRGTENLYMDMYENPGLVKELLEYLIAPSNQFAELQAEVGADIIFCTCPVAGFPPLRRLVRPLRPRHRRESGRYAGRQDRSGVVEERVRQQGLHQWQGGLCEHHAAG